MHAKRKKLETVDLYNENFFIANIHIQSYAVCSKIHLCMYMRYECIYKIHYPYLLLLLPVSVLQK